MAFFTVLNTAFNFLRSIIIAAAYGAGTLSDAYYATVALLYAPAGALADSMTTLVQPRSQAYRREGRENEYLASYLSVTAISFIVLSLGFLFLTPVISPLIFKGFPVESIGLVNRLVLLSLPAIALSPLFVIVDFVLRGDKYFIYGNIGGLLNSSVAAVLLFLLASMGIEAIVFTTLAGYLVNAVTIACAAVRKRLLPGRIDLKLGFEEAVRALPLFAGGLAGIAAGYIEKYIASFLPSGSITLLSMSGALLGTAQGVLVGTFISVYYPFISDAVHDNDIARFNSLAAEAKRMTFGVFGLGIILLAALAHPVLPLVFGYGKFGASDAGTLASVFVAGSFGLLQVALSRIIDYSFYARGDTRTPVLVNILGVMLFGVILKVAAAPSMGIWGIAAAGSLAGITGVVAATVALERIHGLKVLTFFEAGLSLLIIAFSLVVSRVSWSPLLLAFPLLYYYVVTKGRYGLGLAAISGFLRHRNEPGKGAPR